jgi:hypothetical protein
MENSGLEHLTKPFDRLEADERTAEREEGFVDVGSPLVADGQTTKLVQPGQRPFHDPAMATESLAGVDALARDPNADAVPTQEATTPWDIVRLVSMQLGRALPSLAARSPDARDGIDELLEDGAVMSVGAGQADRERGAASVRNKMALRARFAAIRRVRAGGTPPFLAGMLALSKQARSHSIWSAAPSSSSSVWCNCSQTPASCQSRRRRQQVMPLPHPSSWGSISHGMPLLRTKMMPVRQARFGTRGRPPFGFGGSGGTSGSMRSQRASETSGLAMEPPFAQQAASVVPWF